MFRKRENSGLNTFLGSESAVCEFLEAFIDASAGLHANVIVGKETFERE